MSRIASSAQLAKQLAERSVHVKIWPPLHKISQTRDVLKALRQYGDVQFFRSQRYNPGAAMDNTVVVAFTTAEARAKALAASPVTIVTEKGSPAPMLAVEESNASTARDRWDRAEAVSGAGELLLPDLDFPLQLQQLGEAALAAEKPRKKQRVPMPNLPWPIPDPAFTPHLMRFKEDEMEVMLTMTAARTDHLADAKTNLLKYMQSQHNFRGLWRLQSKRMSGTSEDDLDIGKLWRQVNNVEDSKSAVDRPR